MADIHYKFDLDLDAQEQAVIRERIKQAFETGEIMSCPCALIEAWVYPTHKPDFQASLSCTCDAMRPLYSSTPDKD